MREYSEFQKKVIGRYYDNRTAIMLGKLGDIVTELYLADTDRKRDRLWERVEKAMTALKIQPSIAKHILTKRTPEVLALNLKEWLKEN